MSRRWHPYLQVFVGLKFEGIPLEGWRMGFGFRQSLFLSPHCEKKKVNTRTRKGGMKGKKMKKTNEVRWLIWMCLLDGNSFGGEVVIVVVVLVFITTLCEIAPTPKMRSVNQSSNTKKRRCLLSYRIFIDYLYFLRCYCFFPCWILYLNYLRSKLTILALRYAMAAL